MVWTLIHFWCTAHFKNPHIEKFTSFFSYMLSIMRMFLSGIRANLMLVKILWNILAHALIMQYPKPNPKPIISFPYNPNPLIRNVRPQPLDHKAAFCRKLRPFCRWIGSWPNLADISRQLWNNEFSEGKDVDWSSPWDERLSLDVVIIWYMKQNLYIQSVASHLSRK